MDLYSVLGVGLFIAVSALVIICVSVIGTREKTYEEALAEQKRKAQEIALQSKTEKPTKEKKRKHLRKSKEKSEKTYEVDGDHGENTGGSTFSEIPETKVEKVNVTKSKSGASSKKTFSTNQEINKAVDRREIKNENIPDIILETKNNETNTKHKRDKDEGKDNLNANKKEEEIKNKSNKTNVHEKQKQTNPIGKVDDVKNKTSKSAVQSEENHVKEEPVAVKTEVKEVKSKNSKTDDSLPSKKDETQHPPVTSPSKKNKKREFGGGDAMLNGTRLALLIKNAILTETEMQTLIEILLNKQQEGESWVKQGQKMDPLSALKKQLQEKEQALADEQLASQGANTKLKEVRQELTRYVQQERILREKLATAQQEHQTFQLHIHHTQEQRELEVNTLKVEFQQMQSKLEKEHHVAMQRLQEENEKLECAISQIEAESKNMTASEIGRLQLEVDQWRATVDQLQTQNNSYQQNISDLQQHVHQLQQQIQQQEEENNQQSSTLQKQTNELISQLGQMEAEKNSLHFSLQSLQAENNSLQNKLMNSEKSSSNYNRNIKELETKLQTAEENNSKYLSELESRQCDYSNLIEKLKEEEGSYEVQIAKLTEDLNIKDRQVIQLQEEVKNKSNICKKLNEDYETQKSKNNDLRAKNWKVVEALSSAEKRAEENLKHSDKQIREAVTQEVLKEQTLIRELLEKSFPNLAIPSNLNFTEWLHRFEKELKEFIANETSNSELLNKLAQAEETENMLTAQVQNYQAILTETESMLNKLQKSVEREEETWKERLCEKEIEVKQLREENKTLEEEKAALVSSLEQIKAAEEAAAEVCGLQFAFSCVEKTFPNVLSEMQEKLKELKEKLQLEENEKRTLELRFKEAQKTNIETRRELEEAAKELAKIRNEHNTLENLKQELETDLEKEKKVNKDLSSQNVKLSSLVRIGQDSLKAEQESVIKLQKQLSEYKASTTNGSACPNDTTIELDSRSRENDMYNLTDSPAPSPLKSKNKKRGASSKK